VEATSLVKLKIFGVCLLANNFQLERASGVASSHKPCLSLFRAVRLAKHTAHLYISTETKRINGDGATWWTLFRSPALPLGLLTCVGEWVPTSTT
jgi:hypothetical protein